MRIPIKVILLVSILIIITIYVHGQQKGGSQKSEVVNVKKDNLQKIHWYTFKEAVKLNNKKPKKVFMDIYTEWCGWCKRYDAVTFANPEIIKYMNENFYAVKFDAERTDTVFYKNKAYINKNPGVQRATHELAEFFLKGQMSYPTVVFLNEKMEILSPVPGFQQPKAFEIIMNYFGSNAYLNQTFEQFQTTFKGKIIN